MLKWSESNQSLMSAYLSQGGNVREKAKVVLVLMEDDEKLKEERDFAVKTREKTSKSSAGEPFCPEISLLNTHCFTSFNIILKMCPCFSHESSSISFPSLLTSLICGYHQGSQLQAMLRCWGHRASVLRQHTFSGRPDRFLQCPQRRAS